MSSFWTPNSTNQRLEIVLDQICEKLQLDRKRRERVQSAYTFVTKWIEDDPEFWGPADPQLFAYGSYAIGTTVKPKGRDEFDLDFAIQINFNQNKITIKEFQSRLLDRLNSHGSFKGKVEPIRFGARIKYANDFHLDIMPGCSVVGRLDKMNVPDTKKGKWSIRNLKGYINWFNGLFIGDLRTLPLFEYYKRANRIQIKAETESLPEAVPYEVVQPIQKVVQLVKRYRDIYFEDKKELATSSIILTTLVGEAYSGEASISQAVHNVLNQIYYKGETLETGNVIDVYNPADKNEEKGKRELLSSKWREPGGDNLYREFWNFVISMKNLWEKLQRSENKTQFQNTLRQLFGESPLQQFDDFDDFWEYQAPKTPTKPNPVRDINALREIAQKRTPWCRDG